MIPSEIKKAFIKIIPPITIAIIFALIALLFKIDCNNLLSVSVCKKIAAIKANRAIRKRPVSVGNSESQGAINPW